MIVPRSSLQCSIGRVESTTSFCIRAQNREPELPNTLGAADVSSEGPVLGRARDTVHHRQAPGIRVVPG